VASAPGSSPQPSWASSSGRLKREFLRYLKPAVLIVDELGYLPIDKHGADLLFQIISQRYERAPMVITTNRAYKHWPQIFNNDSTWLSVKFAPLVTRC
jgi:DNA replication protein DnaC